ncbi:alpha-N-acetylneuraminate alpha-2,8-sialyltransferase ST8SIA3-like [Glandiceps talaboti]
MSMWNIEDLKAVAKDPPVLPETQDDDDGDDDNNGVNEEDDNKDENGEDEEVFDDTMAPDTSHKYNYSQFLNETKSLELYIEYLKVHEFYHPWEFNVTGANAFRSELRQKTDIHNNIFLTQSVAHIYQTYSYTKAYWSKFKLNRNMYEALPVKSLLNYGQMRKCSVVGSMFMLRNTFCGKSIDDADYVFRYAYNYPGVNQDDIGKKNNMTMIGKSALNVRYGGLKTVEDRKAFQRNMTAISGDVVIPMSASGEATLGMKAIRIAKNRTLFLNPEGNREIKRFLLGKYNYSRVLSTGMYTSMMALSLCDEVHIYGAWPYRKDYKGNPLPFFFSDDTRNVYSFGEYKILRRFHEYGMLRLHLGPCT